MSNEEVSARRKGFNIRDAIVFLVDWRKPMLEVDPLLAPSDGPSTQEDAQLSLLSITLRMIAEVMKAKIRARNTDAVAIVAFGARGLPARSGWPGVRIMRDLRPSDASGVKWLQAFAARLEAGDADAQLNHYDSESESESESESNAQARKHHNDDDFLFGNNDAVQFDKALWAVRHQFTTLSAAPHNILHRKRVFVFTNDDDPSRGNSAVRQLALTQARDLADLGASIDVTLLVTPSRLAGGAKGEMSINSESLNIDVLPWAPRFFAPLVYSDDSTAIADRGSVTVSTVHSLDELSTRIKRKEATRRAIRITHLTLAASYKIGVALYAMIRKATRPLKVELVAETNKPVFKITTHTCESVGQILKQADIRTSFTPDFIKHEAKRVAEGLEDSKVILHGFSKAEIVKAKALGPVGLTMYGFRDKSYLKKKYTLHPATFVFPDDSKFVGSTKAFAILHKRMLERNVIAIVSVRLSDTSGSGIRFAALVPQQENFSETGEQFVAGGMHLHYLPYKDDIYTAWRTELGDKQEEANSDDECEGNSKRNGLKTEEIETGELHNEDEAVSVARRMVRKLKLRDYDPKTFANPDLQRFYNGLELAAGVETTYNPEDDLLNPNHDAMRKRAGHLLLEVKRLEAGDHFDADATAQRFGLKTNKRKAEMDQRRLQRDVEREVKRAKAQAQCDDHMFEDLFQSGTLDTLLVKELQIYCRAHGLLERGTKRNLILAIEDHLTKRIRDKKQGKAAEKKEDEVMEE